MNPLFEAMSHVDDALVEEAAAPPKKRKRIYWIPVALSTAAAAAVAGLFVMNANRMPEIPLSLHNVIVETQTDPTVTESAAAPTDIIDASETELPSGSAVPVLTTVITTVPTTAPTTSPSTIPTTAPTTLPSTAPTTEPSSARQTEPPATVPTAAPTTAEPTVPSVVTTASQTAVPSAEPTVDPTSGTPISIADSPTALNIVTDPTSEPNTVTEPAYYIEFADFGEYRYELRENVAVTPDMVGDALGFAMDGRQVFACLTDGSLILVLTEGELLAYG